MALNNQCGPHCGIKDGYEGHCQSKCCHTSKKSKRLTAKMATSSTYGKTTQKGKDD